MVDPVGGVGGVQDTVRFPRSDRGVAVTVEGAGASVYMTKEISIVLFRCLYILKYIC